MQGYVYFIQAVQTRMIKIGFTSKEPEKRLAGIYLGSPDALVLLGFVEADRGVEEGVRRLLVEHNHHGEWYSPSAVVLAFIARILAGEAPPRSPSFRSPVFDERVFRELRARKATRTDMAEHFGVSTRTIRTWERKYIHPLDYKLPHEVGEEGGT